MTGDDRTIVDVINALARFAIAAKTRRGGAEFYMIACKELPQLVWHLTDALTPEGIAAMIVEAHSAKTLAEVMNIIDRSLGNGERN